jgi:hypothetical protein
MYGREWELTALPIFLWHAMHQITHELWAGLIASCVGYYVRSDSLPSTTPLNLSSPSSPATAGRLVASRKETGRRDWRSTAARSICCRPAADTQRSGKEHHMI